jgi:hypothetical protein
VFCSEKKNKPQNQNQKSLSLWSSYGSILHICGFTC